MNSQRSVNVSKLTPGDTLVEPVFNDSRTKLLGSRCTVDERLISRLAERGITDVTIENAAERTQKHPRKVILPELSMSLDGSCNVPGLVEHCCECATIIAMQPPTPDLPVVTWRCTTCGSTYFGGCAETAKFRGVELSVAAVGNLRTREGEDQPEPNADSIPPTNADRTNRRQQKRYPVAVPVVAVPLGPDFSIAGHAVRMTIRDISQGGAALTHTRFSDVPYYALDFTAAGIELLQVVLKVLRVRNSGPTYDVAGKFVSRVHCAN